jgi:hypothetical protein
MVKTKAPNKYDIHAAETLATMKIEFRAAFLFHGPYWPDEKESRNVWELILTRPAVDCKDQKIVSFRFGQSIADSFRDEFANFRKNGVYYPPVRSSMIPTQRNIPSAYDLLACLTKYAPGSFSDFCGEYGYDNDSIKARDTWQAVGEEFSKVERFFSAKELEIIREIG